MGSQQEFACCEKNEENGRNWKKPVDLNNVQGRGIVDGKYKLKVHIMRRDSGEII